MTVGEWLDACAAATIEESRAEGRAEGEQLGHIKVLTDILADLGPIPDELRTEIQNLDEEALKRWTKLAARVENMKAFLRQLQR